MNAEVDATIGPILRVYATQHGVILSACDGDEPGLQMNLVRWVKGLGLIPRVVGNVKGLQDPYRNPTTQQGWAERWGQNAAMVTSFADGSKISFEQTIVANATGFKVLQRGHVARAQVYDGSIMDIHQLYDLDELRELGGVVDYTVGPGRREGRSCLAEHTDPKQRHYLNLYKMGEGPLYPFWMPYHLVHFETPELDRPRRAASATTSRRRSAGRSVEVCAVAKRDLKAGEVLDEYGMYMTYGEAVNVDEMSARRYLPGGARRGLPADARHRQGPGAHLRRRRAARRAASPTGCGPSSTGTSAARPGSRSGWRRRTDRPNWSPATEQRSPTTLPQPTQESRANRMSEKVSVLICTRDRPDTVGQAIESVALVRLPSFDVHVMDQSTTDATRDIVEALAERFARHVPDRLPPPRQGRAVARVQHRDPASPTARSSPAPTTTSSCPRTGSRHRRGVRRRPRSSGCCTARCWSRRASRTQAVRARSCPPSPRDTHGADARARPQLHGLGHGRQHGDAPRRCSTTSSASTRPSAVARRCARRRTSTSRCASTGPATPSARPRR